MSTFNARLARIGAAVATHGFHKLAANVLAQDGLAPPAEWTDAGVGRVLGTKLATDLLARRDIRDGLISFAHLVGTP